MLSLGINFMVIVTLAVIGAMALSSFWYSPRIFGNTWMKLAGVSEAAVRDSKRMMLYTLFANYAIGLTLLIIIIWAEALTAAEGVIVGLWMGLGLSAMNLLIPYMWEGKSPRLFLITAGSTVLNSVFMSAIMAHLIGKFHI